MDVSAILNNTQPDFLPYVNTVLSDLETIKGFPNHHDAPSRSLKTGHDLREIIDKARNIGQYHLVSNRFTQLQNTLAYSGGSLLLIISIAAAICLFTRGFPRNGGSLALIRNRLISAQEIIQAPRQNEEPQMSWITTEEAATLHQSNNNALPKAHSVLRLGHLHVMDSDNSYNSQRRLQIKGTSGVARSMDDLRDRY